jgi:hypothetical protein
VYTAALLRNVRDATRQGTAELGTARRKHRFVYCCVVAVFTEALPINSLSKSVTVFAENTGCEAPHNAVPFVLLLDLFHPN